MARILLVFGGTGQTKKDLEEFYESDPTQYPEDVVRVYFNGCQDPEISGQYFSIVGMVNPNLDEAANKIHECFTAPNPCLDIDALKEKFGDSVTVKGENLDKPATVDDLTLMGFSRGAVTAFAVAQQLNSLNKPIDIYAEEPVPGDSTFFGSRLTTSELQKNRNLRFCNNIRSAEVIIGRYRQHSVADTFYKQMVPYFGDNCELDIYTIPKKSHFSSNAWFCNLPLAFLEKRELRRRSVRYLWNTKSYNMFFAPSSLTQPLHDSKKFPIRLHPLHRELLQELLSEYQDREKYHDDTLLALYALQAHQPINKVIENAIIYDHLDQGNALRNFVIEFENMIQYALRKYSKQTNPSPDFLTFIDKFRKQVYNLVWEPRGRIFRLNPDITKNINLYCKSLKKNFEKIGLRTHYSELKQLLKHYLANPPANLSELDHFLPLLPISDISQLPTVPYKDWLNSMSSQSPRLSNRESTYLKPNLAPSDPETSEDHSNQSGNEEASNRWVIERLEQFVNTEIQRLKTVNFFGWLLPNCLTWFYPPIQTKIAEFEQQLINLNDLKNSLSIDPEALNKVINDLQTTASRRRYIILDNLKIREPPTIATKNFKSQLENLPKQPRDLNDLSGTDRSLPFKKN